MDRQGSATVAAEEKAVNSLVNRFDIVVTDGSPNRPPFTELIHDLLSLFLAENEANHAYHKKAIDRVKKGVIILCISAF